MKRVILFVVGILLTLLFMAKHPQSLIFPLWIFVYLYKDKLSKLFNGRAWIFMVVGVMFGLIIEVFAIWNNINQPIEVRSIALFHASPVPDLILGFLYYLVIISGWYVVLRKIKFSPWQVFIIAGLFGVFVEQYGRIFLGMLAGLPGVLVALFVFFVHGIYPFLGYYVTENNFSKKRIEVRWWHYPLALLVLFLFWQIIAAPIFLILKPMFG